jgi:mono/diheme cytochrome c family protein
MSALRLGDEIDDYCPRCKLLLSHAIASVMGTTVVKVVCQTCHSEHPFKNGEVPPKKKAGPRAALMDQVLAKAGMPAAAESPEDGAAPAPAQEEPKKKKTSSPHARYITRHTTRPPRGKV